MEKEFTKDALEAKKTSRKAAKTPRRAKTTKVSRKKTQKKGTANGRELTRIKASMIGHLLLITGGASSDPEGHKTFNDVENLFGVRAPVSLYPRKSAAYPP